MAKKKKNKQPAKKRDRGTPLNLDRDFLKVEEKCEEIVKNNLIDGQIESYRDGVCEIIFFENNDKKSIKYQSSNTFLTFIKNIKFQKRYKKNENKDIITNIYCNFLMPQDTYNNMKNLDIDNLHLQINKFSYAELIKNKNELKFIYKNLYCMNNVDRYVKKYMNTIEKLNKYLNVKSFSLTTNWRLAIGLGTASVYETSINLHHIYGIPFIPAQSIKGSFRNYMIESYFENSEEKAFKDSGFVDIFGSNEAQGKVLFFDSFSKNPKLQLDIMNSHYSKYYSDREAPTDTQSPIPINFLTIKDAEFKFMVATKNNIEIESGKFKGEKILDFIKNELSQSLQIFGLGAKTAVGYGYFDS